jgi:hypothetical protein
VVEDKIFREGLPQRRLEKMPARLETHVTGGQILGADALAQSTQHARVRYLGILKGIATEPYGKFPRTVTIISQEHARADADAAVVAQFDDSFRLDHL